MASLKKKLRFVIRQIAFTDAQNYFEALPGAHTEYALEMSQTAFRNISVETVHNDCIAFSQLLRMKWMKQMKDFSYRDLKLESRRRLGKVYGELEYDFVVVSFPETGWDNSIRIPARCREDGAETRAVTSKTKDMAEWLFLNGFTVQNEKTREAVHYVRFSGSASMSRNGKVMFVNADHEPELSRRVTLGLEDDGCLEWAAGLIPSKWDAYKGLCLSDGYAMAWLKETSGMSGAPELSEAGVVFVKDMTWDKLSVPASPCDVKPLCFEVKNPEKGKAKEEGGDSVKVEFRTGDYAEKEMNDARKHAVLTDGVGLIAPAAARWMSAALCGNPNTVSTFQIRLPFVKGMVHAVDFPAYLAERGVTEISDAWGNRRSVSSVWMVLPFSMFKAHKWFAQRAADVPRLYHEKLREYGHDLVITQRHIPKAENAEPFRLNYEVLQTCGLNETEFEALLRGNLKQYAMLCKDRKTRFAYLTGGADDSETVEDTDEENLTTDDLLEAPEDAENDLSASSEDEDEDEAAETTKSGDVSAILAKAVRKNPALLNSKKAKDILTDAANALAFRKLLRGNLAFPEGSQGESRYLTCDLGRYLDYLDSLGGAKRADCFRPLSPGEFYAPGFRAKGDYCALFRTPHYSRNEHLVLRPLPEDSDPARERWFGHLRGVLMIPAENFAAARLGGADFDGDHVSVVDDNIYVGAVERALGLSGLDAATRDRLGGSTLPFIVIPDANKDANEGESGGASLYNWDAKATPDENRRRLAEKEFRSFRTASENRVGHFSNYAFTHGAAAYGTNPDGEKERLVQKLVALCGMEIDAAKTGRKPECPEGAKVKSGLFLSMASKAKRAKKPTWSGESKKNALSLEEDIYSFEYKPQKAKPSPCLMDSIPGQLLYAHKNPKSFLDNGCETVTERGLRFSSCFRFPVDGAEWDGAYSKELLENLSHLHRAYLSANYLIQRQGKQKPVSYDKDLTRILWPRFLETGDAAGFNEVHTLCKRFFHTLNNEQKANIRNALSEAVPFEQTRENREVRLMESLRKAADFDPEQEEGWETLRGQLLNFDRNGFSLPYLMLNLAREEQRKDRNPYFEELKSKDRETLLEKTRKKARNLCGEAFPGKDGKTVSALLAAHLAKYVDDSISSGKESFFWMILGEKDAMSFLRNASKER